MPGIYESIARAFARGRDEYAALGSPADEYSQLGSPGADEYASLAEEEEPAAAAPAPPSTEPPAEIFADPESDFGRMYGRYREQAAGRRGEEEAATILRELERPEEVRRDRSAFGPGPEQDIARLTAPLGQQITHGLGKLYFETPLVPFRKLNISPQQFQDALDLLATGSPDLTEEEAAQVRLANSSPDGLAKVAAGTQEAITSTLEGMSTPFSITTLGLGGALKGIAGRLLSGAFAADMATHTPEQVVAFRDALASGDPEAIARTGGGLGLSGAFLFGAARHAATKESPAHDAARQLLEAMDDPANVEQLQARAKQFALEATLPDGYAELGRPAGQPAGRPEKFFEAGEEFVPISTVNAPPSSELERATPAKPELTTAEAPAPTPAPAAEPPPTTTAIDPRAAPVHELPLAQLKLSSDVPNFKERASEATGVVPGEELAGGYERLGTAPIVVWQRLNGDLEVITGRHRLDLARRTGEKTIPAQVVSEAAGFTKEHALTFDAEANIRDGQGSVRDYAHYFRNSRQRLTPEEATARGLLSRAKGQAGFDLGYHASDDLYALYSAERINEAQALAIVRAAPDNPGAQQIGTKYALLGQTPEFIGNLVKAALSESGGRAETLDLFGRDDSAMKAMVAQAKRAAAAQKELVDQVRAVQGAAKNPAAARKLGVDVNDPASVLAKVQELKAEIERWQNWPVHPDLVAKTKGEAAPAAKPAAAPPKETLTLAPPETVAEQQARLEAEAKAAEERAAAQSAADREAAAKREMLERAAKPLGGDLGSAGQGGLFAEPGQQEIFQPPAPGGPTINQGQLGELGMGGAKPGEFRPGGEPTAIKNAQVDVERQRRGLPAALEPLRRSFGAVWDEAMAAIDRDPARQERLIAELKANPRAITDLEDALLLHRQVDLQNDYARLTRDLANAYEDSRTFPNRLDAYEELKVRVQEVSDRLLELYDVNKSVGTETGRGLNARKMLANEDFTLASMEMQMRAANDGAPLTDAQRAELQAAHEKIAGLERELAVRQAAVDDATAGRRAAEAVAEMAQRTAAELRVTYDPRVLKIAEEIVGKLEKQADAARARLRARSGEGRLNAIPAADLYDYGVIGAAKIARKGLDLARFTEEMVSEFGENIRSVMDKIWAQANTHLENEGSKYGDKAPQVRSLLRRQDELQRRTNITAGLKKAATEGVPLELLGDYIRKLAESFVRGGIRTRDPLIDAVHRVLTEEFAPDITRRQTMDAISGYGQFKPLNPDAIKAELRALKGQMQQVAKLEDIQARQPLKKTGVQRREVGDEERRLIAQVNEAKRRYGVVVLDPASQLRSALDAVRTRLKNQVADLEYQLATKQRIVKTRTPAPFDNETKLLEARRDELRRQLDELLPRPDLTDAQRLGIAQRNVERSIAILEERIKNRDVTTAEPRRLTSPALEALQARRTALRQEWEMLRDTLDPERRARLELSTLKARLRNQEAHYTERLARGDFTARPKREIAPDEEVLRLKARAEMAKAAWRRARELDQLKRRHFIVRAGHAVREALNLPRAVLASWDVSAVLRQGGFIALGHPLRAAAAIGPMFRALVSPERAAMVDQEILSRPNAPLYARAKLYLAPLEGTRLSAMEEQFMSSLATRIPGVAHSNRAFVIFLNRLRADSFDAMVGNLQRRGAPLNEPELRAVANYINVATGRGSMGQAAAAASTLATAFFSPRLVTSRFQLLLGQPFYGGSARTRLAVAGEYAHLLAGLAVVYALANLAGATIETDPRSSDFGKLKFGDTRVDPLMGLSQVTVLLGRETSGSTKTPAGEVKPIRGKVPFGDSTGADVALRFLRTKLAPVPGAVLDVASGQNVVGEPVTAGSVAQQLAVPLSFQDIYSVMAADGIPKGTALGVLSLFGAGVQQQPNIYAKILAGEAMRKAHGMTPEQRDAYRQQLLDLYNAPTNRPWVESTAKALLEAERARQQGRQGKP